MLEYFVWATIDGDVEVFAIVVTTSIATVVNIAFPVDVEVPTHFCSFSHVESLVKGWVHSESIFDIDNAVILFFSEFTCFSRFSFIEVKVGPFGCHVIAPHVHRGVVGIGLTCVFSRFTLRSGNITCLNRCQHQSSDDEGYKSLGSHG